MEYFRFNTVSSVSDGEFVLRQEELGLVAGGETFEQAVSELQELWEALRSGVPVGRPALVDAQQQVEHEAWVLAVLTGELHMTAEQIQELDIQGARQLVLDHWSRPQV